MKIDVRPLWDAKNSLEHMLSPLITTEEPPRLVVASYINECYVEARSSKSKMDRALRGELSRYVR
jgi:hypothetical protein